MKVVLTPRQVHRLLGFPADVRVAGLRAVSDPDAMHVLVEGDALPEELSAGADCAVLAYHDQVEAPYLWHPVHGARDGQVPTLTWGDWKPGDKAPETGEFKPAARDGDLELLEQAWGIMANASGGDWGTQSEQWREAAKAWRDAYHARLGTDPVPAGDACWRDPRRGEPESA